MDFQPPADARVITAQQLDAMIAEGLDEPLPKDPAKSQNKIPVELKGPVVLRGNIVGKEIAVTGGSLWIDGNVENCDISIETEATKQATEQWIKSRSKSDRDQADALIVKTRQEAAAAGIGLHIKGDVKKCDEIMVPNISITGNVIAGSNRPTDRENWTNRTHIVSFGNLQVDGNIKGQKETQDMCPTVEFWYTKRADEPQFQLKPGETIADKMLHEMDTLRAEGNIIVQGDVEGYGLISASGGIHMGGKKTGFVITHKNDTTYLENRPTAEEKAPPRRGIVSRTLTAIRSRREVPPQQGNERG
jgi:hypothetical protein